VVHVFEYQLQRAEKEEGHCESAQLAEEFHALEEQVVQDQQVQGLFQTGAIDHHYDGD
jgi:hypothetical protein